MKLIIKQYLASLKERDELDALLPDLLSQMGLNVFSRPSRGARQDGVDIGAVGAPDGIQKVYLFSLKGGDLTRSSWDSSSPQSLRPSLNQILDTYIRNKLPAEHRGKPIVVCICLGGEIQEAVRADVRAYTEKNTSGSISFEEWNGDKLADLIQAHLLREDLLPKDSRSSLRKALALLDEPGTSFKQYNQLVSALYKSALEDNTVKLRAIRQMCICLWIVFAWSRDAGNLESAYRSAERTILLAWELTKSHHNEPNRDSEELIEAFKSIIQAYIEVTNEYVGSRILPHVDKMDGLSSAVRPSSNVDTNLKLFEVLGRLSLFGLWMTWSGLLVDEEDAKNEYFRVAGTAAEGIKALISNNPCLLSPIKDDQAIDIALALLLLSRIEENTTDIRAWLSEMIARSTFAYDTNGLYPCTIRDYAQLLDHPKKEDPEYKKEVTEGSILYPLIALWAAILKDDRLYRDVAEFKETKLKHCNYQIWYPDETTELRLYTNDELHGTVFSDVPVNRLPTEYLDAIWAECDNTKSFDQLSAVLRGFWPLIFIACRHYRIPVPVQFTLSYRNKSSESPEQK